MPDSANPVQPAFPSYAVPLAVDQTIQSQLNPAYPVSIAKEKSEPGIRVEVPQVDMAAGVAAVEQERTPEISPEVEAYLSKVESHHDQQPQEVVFADGTTPQAQATHIAEPVIVIPITPQNEKEAQLKSTKFSIKWLVEWSHKLIKMFVGRVIYRQADEHSESL